MGRSGGRGGVDALASRGAVAYKRCSLCGEHKLRTAFHRMRSVYDGRYPRCKECRREERLRKLGRLPDASRAAASLNRNR